MKARRRNRRGRGPLSLVPGVLGFVGTVFLVLAAVPIYGSQPPEASQVHGFGVLTVEHLETVNEVKPMMAQAGQSDLAPPAPTAVVRQPVPLDALPVNRAQAVSGGLPRPSSGRSQDTGAIRVAIASNLTDSALGARLIESLRADRRLEVVETSLATLDRPDVLLILDSSSAGAGVWYCGPSPNESSALATAVLDQVASLGQEAGDAIGDAVDASLSCSTLHAGRARMAAVDLRLPLSEEPEEHLAALVATGVRDYIERGEARIRTNRTNREITWPAYGPITSHYGPDHALGIDIGQWEGSVVAATDGRVAFAGGDACCSYGLYVIVESPDGVTTLYGHLDALFVQEGESVRAGQPLGPVGNTGHSSGTHLHFETLVNGVRVNPLSVLP
jgi:hypothetical protein